MNNNDQDKKAKFDVGGQAVMEGVMMRSPSATAVTVRRPDGTMVTKLTPFVPLKDKHPWMGKPFIRGIIAELGGKRKEIPYEQPKRRAGKTHNNWYTLYDAAMLSVTSYTKAGMRLAVFGGMILAFLSLLIGLVYLVLKLIYWNRFNAGQAPIIIIVSLIGSILLSFMGLLGEYIAAMNLRIMKRPLVVEEERLNFDEGTAEAIDGEKQ